MSSTTITEYERNQQFSALTRWLHSYRYRNAIDVMGELRDLQTIRVLEVGCGLGKLFGVLNERFPIAYTGIDLDAEHIEIARARHGHHANFRAIAADAVASLDDIESADIVFALETLEHLPGNAAVRVTEKIARIRPRLFICSVPVEIGPALWCKNVGSWLCGYVRYKSYTWSETFWAGLYNFDRVGPHQTGHRGFDWRWLAQTIRHSMQIREIRKFPISFMPAALSTSVFMICEPRQARV
jgi:SAM-dependent methyltransferase